MSTVVAVIKDGIACIGAESQTTIGNIKVTTGFVNGHKLMHWGENTFGMVGSASMFAVLDDLISKSDEAPELATPSQIFSFFRKLHPRLKKKYYIRAVYDDDDNAVETSRLNILLVNPHGVFQITPWRSVNVIKNFWAIGSGQDFALGALHVLMQDSSLDAEQITQRALEAACAMDLYSNAPLEWKTFRLRKT